MLVIPAIDISGGKVVRLTAGSFRKIKEYSSNPIYVAKFWCQQGAKYLHIVDLDGAAIGKPINLEVIKEILKAISIPVEVGGGIRTISDINSYLEMGVDRVILGTSVVKDLSFLDKEQIKPIADKLSVSWDVRIDGKKSEDIAVIGTEGWLKEVSVSTLALLEKMTSVRVGYLNYTNRSKDGTLLGLTDEDFNYLNLLLDLLRDKPIHLIYGGGVSGLEDISKIAKLKNKKIFGIVIGKALYENKFSLSEAQKIADVS